MGTENNNKGGTSGSTADENVSFPDVTAVVSGWTLDFVFVSLCRRFKEGGLDEFNETLSTFEAISQSPSLKQKNHDEKIRICAFLARVMYGKQLDVHFEEDVHVMPLMSAFKIWSALEDIVEDKNLFKAITVLLLVQSVAVCMEKGQMSSASSVLKWFGNNKGFLQKSMGVKLSTIVTQKETYHPFLMSFSFSRLRETVQSFLDTYLEKNPSDYLLKEATKMIQSSQSSGAVEAVVTQDSSVSEITNESTQDRKKKKNSVRLRAKRRLLSAKITDVWTPDTGKKPFVSVRRISLSELSQMTSEKSINTPKIKQKTRKPPQKWTHQLDQYLKDGVRHHGRGKWSRILLDYDFEGRTGTMLKDRWRVLMRAHKVD